ncbi:MAG TPA: hypothetical protein VN788_03900 [Verrucomicrobiae bacterium]|nr:hypothetical protein [Verrucomicrobiae bacterium]
MNLQHVNVKLMLDSPADADLAPLIPIFYSWIQGQVFEELLLDVADYRHVPAGPGVVLIGHQANYSVDNIDNRLGVRYNRKAELDGGNQDRLAQAARAALIACRRLEAEPAVAGKLQFNGRDLEIFINDRLLAPNSDSTFAEARPDLQRFGERLFRGSQYSLTHDPDPRKLFAVSLKASDSFPLATLLHNLGD